ncbi:MAG: DinB family protein [Balneolaceae bacterium]
MNNRIDQVDANTKQFVSHFGSLGDKELNWKPNPETWSIAQNIDHLIHINNTYGKIFSDLKSGRLKLPFIARFKFITNLLGDLILKAVEPTRKKKTKTFAIWEPSTSNVRDDIVEYFVKSQDELKNHIIELKEEIGKDTIVYSPINKQVVLSVGSAFDIIITHEQRHLNQCKEIVELIRV